MKYLAWIALLFTVQAFAGEVRITDDPWKYELKTDAGVAITELVNGKPVPIKRNTMEECEEALRAQFMRDTGDVVIYRCNLTARVTVTAVCEPEPDGAIQGKLDVQGAGADQTFVIKGELQTKACSDDTRWDIREVSWIAKPFREEPARMCWKKVETPIANCDGTPVAAIPDGPPMLQVQEPGPWIAGVDYDAGQPCPAAANGNCFIPPTVATRPCPAGAGKYCSDSQDPAAPVGAMTP